MSSKTAASYNNPDNTAQHWTSGQRYNFCEHATKGITQSTETSKLFFSEYNVELLHNAMRSMVYKASEGRFNISRQSDESLRTIMRGTYLSYAKNTDKGWEAVKVEVRDLNTRVLEYTVNDILKEIKTHEYYMRDRNTQPVPIAWGKSESIKGTKSGEFKTFF